MAQPDLSRRRAGGDAILLGALVLCGLVYFAWRYYLERTACFDSAFFSWMMIDQQEPQSVLGRYGSWLPQLIPVRMLRADVPLEMVLRTYSLCLVGVHVIVFAIIVLLRDRRGAIAQPIALVAGFHYMFYYGVSELYQGLSLTVLLWVLVRRFLEADGARARWAWAAAAVLLNAWASFYHQLLVLPLLFLLGYEALRGARWKHRPFLWLSAVLVGWYLVKIAVMPATDYEQARMPKAADLLHYTLRLGELGSTQHLLMVWTKFKSLLLLIGLGGAVLVLRRRWAQLLWTALFSLGFLLLILVTDRDGGSPTIYENYYPVLGLVWGIVFADACMADGLRWPKLRAASWAIVLALGLLQVQRGHHLISYKVGYMQRVTTFLREHDIQKGYGSMASFPWEVALGEWPLGMETALVSAVNGPEEVATFFIIGDTARVEGALEAPTTFLGPSWSPTWFHTDALDRTYFDFAPGPYVRVNTIEPDSTWQAFRQGGVVLSPPPSPVRLVHDRFTMVEVPITNHSDRTLASRWRGTIPIRLSCRIMREDGSLYHATGGTPLELDIPPGTTYPQGLLIERPVDAGTYRVHADLSVGDSLLGPGTDFIIEVPRFGW